MTENVTKLYVQDARTITGIKYRKCCTTCIHMVSARQEGTSVIKNPRECCPLAPTERTSRSICDDYHVAQWVKALGLNPSGRVKTPAFHKFLIKWVDKLNSENRALDISEAERAFSALHPFVKKYNNEK